MNNGADVQAFERAFAAHVGADYAIAMCNGTVTLHTALAALGVTRQHFKEPVPYVAVPPLTMASTSLAVLHAGGVPVYVDIDPDTWLMEEPVVADVSGGAWLTGVPVSLYGLHYPMRGGSMYVDDAAQTLRPHSGCAFTSYSFQASKILALGEGGMLVTNDEELAHKARSFASLGYPLNGSSRIDPETLKSPDYKRHPTLGYNYRMNDATARLGLIRLKRADTLLEERRLSALNYEAVIAGTPWIVPQHVPEGWTHDYWCYAVAVESEGLKREFGASVLGSVAELLADRVVHHGGERPYAAWALSYNEPVLERYATHCPVAESLQPRILQFQTNDLAQARTNAAALKKAVREIG